MGPDISAVPDASWKALAFDAAELIAGHNCYPVPYLDKTNVIGVLPEALSADVQVVLADDAALVAAHTAACTMKQQ